MTDHKKLVEALRMGADYGVEEESVGKLCADAAVAIEALQAEVGQWKAAVKGQEDGIKVLQDEVKRLKEVIDELREAQTYIDHYGDKWMTSAKDIPTSAYNHGYMDGKNEAQPHWVSVENELPYSGILVLACCEKRGIDGYRYRYVCDAFHTDKKSIPCSYNDDIDEEYDEETDEYYFPVGWWEAVRNWDDYSCVAINDVVTHWMPLPEPPQEVQE